MARTTGDAVTSMAEMPNEILQEFLIALIKEFDGPEGLASDLRADYVAAEAGSPARVRIATAIVSLLERFGSLADVDMNDLDAVRQAIKQLEQEPSDDERSDA